MLGGGDFVLFFRPGGWSFAVKSCPQGGILMEKLVACGLARRGMVTGQIVSCISTV